MGSRSRDGGGGGGVLGARWQNFRYPASLY